MPVDLDEARRMLDGVTLFVDQDGDVCCTGRDKNLVFCPACGDGNEDWTVLNPDIVQAIVDRFNAHAAMVAEIEELRADYQAASDLGDSIAAATYRAEVRADRLAAIIRECHGADRAPTEAEFLEALGGA